MNVPEPPTLSHLEHISPTLYEASIHCMAKAAWYAFGDRKAAPDHPAAILGRCLHFVLAAANTGNLTAGTETERSAARRLFDQTAKSLYENAHPLMKSKFVSVEQLPYYHLHRERAAFQAAGIGGGGSPGTRVRSTGGTATTPQLRTEKHLTGADRLIVGRPDHIDGRTETVVDYKTGITLEDETDPVSDVEARQLRLYAHLSHENGIAISKGVVVRGDGRRCEIDISNAEADAEADKARRQLRAINAAVDQGKTFEELAAPSPLSCCMCPCIPMCEPFWKNSEPTWVDDCGLHVEGRVIDITKTRPQGVNLVTLQVEVQRGTLGLNTAAIEQVPESWLTIEHTPLPQQGDLIRVVHGRVTQGEDDEAVVRVDKTLTSLWVVPSGERADMSDA